MILVKPTIRSIITMRQRIHSHKLGWLAGSSSAHKLAQVQVTLERELFIFLERTGRTG